MRKTKSNCISGILVAMSLSSAMAQNQKTDLAPFDADARVETAKRDLLSADSREKRIRVALSEKAPEVIVGKRFVLGGPLVTLFKSDNSLQSFNPFAARNSRADQDPVRIDPYLPTPRGFTLLRLRF